MNHSLIALLFCVVALGSVDAQPFTGKVIAVKDGDTVVVLDVNRKSHDVRLAGIDAPEKAQPFGQRSKEHLSDGVFGQQATVEGNKIDKYGRRVAKIIVNGADANLEQIRAGFAWHYKDYESEQSSTDRILYSSAENSARLARIGLWRDSAPTAPWDWRRENKTADKQKVVEQQNSECPCAAAKLCSGSRGGQFCIKPNGKKQY